MPALNSPDLEWLQRKWGLPDAALPAVARLLHEESSGSTACRLDAEPSDWGAAAAEAGGEAHSPLVLWSHDGSRYLQSRRLFEAEKSIANRILELARNETSSAASEGELRELFPSAAKDDGQAAAARVAVSRRFAMVTGGPGTGKTYTLARILALLVAADISPAHIKLAAPTGKAAERMKGAVGESLNGLPARFQERRDALRQIADGSRTLHSLLGYNPGKGKCRFHAEHPLDCKALIVDECSMVDVLLWQSLLRALPSDARLILLGDPNQLESVGQGNVFGELTRAAADPASPLHAAHVHLTEARRFKDRPGIRALVRALENADAGAAADLLEAARHAGAADGLGWVETSGGILAMNDFPDSIREALEKISAASSPEAALEGVRSVCILTAQREFFVGAKAMSAAIDEDLLQRPGGIRNQPIIVDRNDPETGLRNGTVGVIHAASDGKRKACFPASGGALQEFALAKLPDFSPAWAITIHRSQGSEYDNVLVILPHEASPLATRELLYTAVTRARHNVYIAGSLASLRKAVLTPSTRNMALSTHLAAR